MTMSFLARVRELLRRRPARPELTADTPGLSVVATAFDPVEADSAALERASQWVPDHPAVLRHHLRLPASGVAEASRILAQDGWELRPVDDSGDPATVHALRVQRLDALHCAQERARMAGLAQRLGGESLGWDALQPGPAATTEST
jgi:hypothetical protein